jgi:hypothetical protein
MKMSILNRVPNQTVNQAPSSPEMGSTSPLMVTVQPESVEMSKVIAAAIVDEKFRHLLLADPVAALKGGYHGQTFNLGSEEVEFILSVQAVSLADFASQWVKHKERNGRHNDQSGNESQ